MNDIESGSSVVGYKENSTQGDKFKRDKPREDDRSGRDGGGFRRFGDRSGGNGGGFRRFGGGERSGGGFRRFGDRAGDNSSENHNSGSDGAAGGDRSGSERSSGGFRRFGGGGRSGGNSGGFRRFGDRSSGERSGGGFRRFGGGDRSFRDNSERKSFGERPFRARDGSDGVNRGFDSATENKSSENSNLDYKKRDFERNQEFSTRPTRSPEYKNRSLSSAGHYRSSNKLECCSDGFERKENYQADTKSTISPTHINQKIAQLSEIARKIGMRLLCSFEKIRVSSDAKSRKAIAVKAYESVAGMLMKEVGESFLEFNVIFPCQSHLFLDQPTPGEQKREIYADPIVGWKNFCAGRPGWGVLISGYFDGVCETVVLYDPLCSEEYTAGLQQGAFLNKHRLRSDDKHIVILDRDPQESQEEGICDESYSIDSRALSMAYVVSDKLQKVKIATHTPLSWESMLLLVSEACARIVGKPDNDVDVVCDKNDDIDAETNVDAETDTETDAETNSDADLADDKYRHR